MPRYIDADRLISALGINQFSHEVEHCIEKHPEIIADVRENVHGHWVVKYAPDTHWYQVTCSHCGEDVTSSIPLIGFFPNVRPMWDYCPECGAMMDNVESNT